MPHPSLAEIFIAFLRLGFISFGGPAMVEYIRQTVVLRKRWLEAESFTRAIITCQGVPGAIVVNIASYCGFQIRGLAGMMTAFIAFLLPSFVIMLVFSFFYANKRDIGAVKSIFTGLEVVVVAIVINAAFRFCRERFDSNLLLVCLAVISAALLFFSTSPLVVICLAAGAGIIFFSKAQTLNTAMPSKQTSLRHILVIASVFAALWLTLFLINEKVFGQSMIMTKIALMSFGGVYTALPIMYHEVVESGMWMDNKTFMDGIALGQITPGPILINATFVGYMTNGIIGAIALTAAIFSPGLLLVSLAMPFVSRLEGSPYFRGATRGMIAAFAGLLIFISVKFVMTVHWDLTRLLFLLPVLVFLLVKNNVLVAAIVGAVISVFIF